MDKPNYADPALFEIEIYGQGFTIKHLDDYGASLLQQFAHPYAIFKFDRPEGSHWTTKKRWIFSDMYGMRHRPDRKFRFHISQLKPLHEFLVGRGVVTEHVRIKFTRDWEAASSSLKLKPHIKLYDYQETGKSFVLNAMEGSWLFGRTPIPDDFGQRLIGLRTGAGKTVTGLATACEAGERLFLFLVPKYIDKWIEDLKDLTDINDKKDLLVCTGEKGVRGFLQMAKEGSLQAKVVIFPIRTMVMFFKKFDQDLATAREMFDIDSPVDLFRYGRPGTLLIDEAHEEFLGVYKVLTYSAVNRVIKLSATFESTEQAATRVMELMAPPHMRYEPEVIPSYTDMYPVKYVIRSVPQNRITYTERGNTAYSQTAYEKFLFGNPKLLDGFTKMVDRWFRMTYVENYMDGDKVRLYFGSIQMCTHITNYLKNRYPQYTIARYVEDDPYENIIVPQVAVTTVLSAGTAIDMKGLRFVLSWIAINSPRANKQLLGRLRKLDDRDVRYYYFYCANIAKHVEYHEARKEFMLNRIKSIRELADNEPL